MDIENDLKPFVIDDTQYQTRHTRKFAERKPYAAPDPRVLRSIIPGVIRQIVVRPGQSVAWGDSLLTLEAMKMKNDVTSPRDGVIARLLVEEGMMVAKHQPLLEYEE